MNEHQQRMIEIMEEISDECYCSTWIEYVEFHAWLAMTGGCRYLGRSEISEDQCKELRDLASITESWPMMNDEHRIVFVAFETFMMFYSKWFIVHWLKHWDAMIKQPHSPHE